MQCAPCGHVGARAGAAPSANAQLAVRSSCQWRRRMIVKCMLNQDAALDRVFQALADPARRVMVDRLARGPASVSELAQPLAMSLPAALRTAESWIARRRAGWERRLDRLGEYLAAQDDQQKEGGDL